MDENNSSENTRNLENTEQNLAPLIDNTVVQSTQEEEVTEPKKEKSPLGLVLIGIAILVLIIIVILKLR